MSDDENGEVYGWFLEWDFCLVLGCWGRRGGCFEAVVVVTAVSAFLFKAAAAMVRTRRPALRSMLVRPGAVVAAFLLLRGRCPRRRFGLSLLLLLLLIIVSKLWRGA